MAMSPALNSMSDIIPAITIAMAGSAPFSLGRGKKLFSEPEMGMPSSSGENLSTPAARRESTVPFFGTKARSSHLSLSDRLTQSLITSGLVRGITHTSIRKQSGAAIRASALWPLDGGVADEPRAVCSSLNASFHTVQKDEGE